MCKNKYMKKLLIITPHLSTGGAPQVTVNKVELLRDHFEIKVVEYSFLAWSFVVQRLKIIDMLREGVNFHSLGENKYNELVQIMQQFSPDVVVMEEFPEMFMDDKITAFIYSETRTWKISETTHDSSFNPKWKKWMPDSFVFVSSYNIFKYIHLDIPMDVIEYPIDKKSRNKVERQKQFGLDPSYKHFVTVGLFTPRKNQAYAFELGKYLKNHKVKFHFLGNQAGNFEDYWKPLMADKPDNCVVWGERNDVNTFLEACDVFFFPSKGDRGNKELNPIAIKEAMEYDDIIKVMYNLDVYCNKYNNEENMVYLTGDIGSDAASIVKKLNLDVLDEECIILGTYPNIKDRVQWTKDTINSLKPLGRKIILLSHYPVDQDIQRMVDYYIYDAHNPLTHHSYYTRFYNEREDYFAEININGLKDSNQSLTVLTNIFNGAKAAKELGFKRFFYTTYDVILDPRDIPAVNDAFKTDKKICAATLPTPQGKGIQTNGIMFDTDFFLKEFDDVRTPEEWNTVCARRKCENYLEDYLSKVIFSFNQNDIQLVTNDKDTLLIHSGLGVASNSEYYSVIPVEGKANFYMFYFFTYNRDNRKIYISIGDDMSKRIIPSQKHEWYYEFEFKGEPILVRMDFYDEDDCYKIEEFKLNKDTLHKYTNTGKFKWKKKDKPRIKLVHIQTTLNDEREQASRASLEQVKDHGWQYILHTNEPYKSLPPSYNCIRPSCVSMELFNEEQVRQYGTALTPAHYGCYEAFKNAILSEFYDCDFLMVCEGDCIIETDIHFFVRKVEQCAHLMGPNGINYMSFGDKDTLEYGWPQSPMIKDINDDMYVTDHIIGLQSIMFPISVADYLKNTLRKHKWDASDMYFNNIFAGPQMGIVKKRLTTQADGFSLIDNMQKTFRK
jgi:glycosyltransferase involved in cell wall biosynthesis